MVTSWWMRGSRKASPKYTRQWLQQEFAAGRKRGAVPVLGPSAFRGRQLTKSCLSQWWMEDFYTTADSYLLHGAVYDGC